MIDKMLHFNKGEQFKVSLPENKTTGYSWQITTSPGLKILSSDYTIECLPDQVGCGGKVTWTVVGTQTGIQTFTGVYKRPWDSSDTSQAKILIIISDTQ